MLVIVLADTHAKGTLVGKLGPALLAAIERADLILHAGDITSREALEDLRSLAPTAAVLGNNDVELVGHLPMTRELELDGVRIAMVHDSGDRAGRAARSRRRFPDAQIVVFGHSHEPCNELGLDGQILFNPGSPTRRRREPQHTFGRLELRSGKIVDRAIVAV